MQVGVGSDSECGLWMWVSNRRCWWEFAGIRKSPQTIIVLSRQDTTQFCCRTSLSCTTSGLQSTFPSNASGPLPAPPISLPEKGSWPPMPWSKRHVGGEAVAGSKSGTGGSSGQQPVTSTGTSLSPAMTLTETAGAATLRKGPWQPPVPPSNSMGGTGEMGGEGGGEGVGRRAS
jgi:hypothetical protein